MINWLLKQLFYFRYFILNEKYEDPFPKISRYRYFIPFQPSFFSQSFTDGQWSEFLPWYKESKVLQDWNTYGHFNQQYGRFYFKARLDGLIGANSHPAIWLLEISDNYYYEIDIEMFWDHFGYTVWCNHTGGQEQAKIQRSNFYSHKLYRNLQKDFHLFLIDWSKDWIRMYINGILAARFPNEIHVPMQIICSKISAQKIIVQKL